MASIYVIVVSGQLMMILKDKKVLYLKMHLILICLRTSGSPRRPPNGVFLVISPSPLPCALIPTNRRNTPKSCARRLDRTETLCLLSDVCSNKLNQNECDDNMLSYVSHDVKRMNFRYMSSEVSNLYLQTRSTKNTQFEHQVSYLNLASRALSIVVQDMDVEVSFWDEESINFKLVSFQYSTNQSLEDWLLIFKVLGVTCFVDVQLLPFSSAHWLLCLGNIPLLVTGASLPNDHYNFLTVDILLPWSITQRRRLYTTPT
ncbi:hypothetical protein F2Q69_00019696 [Brassica cretica]|uniref:Uncharacterized protein n=1 Tax=Brassica cretica TaxID=69181 RepID=A0A8S9QJB9_BRACR|nr:hypothetical protein F2Q69_00019696 [Brassica cretica]